MPDKFIDNIFKIRENDNQKYVYYSNIMLPKKKKYIFFIKERALASIVQNDIRECVTSRGNYSRDNYIIHREFSKRNRIVTKMHKTYLNAQKRKCIFINCLCTVIVSF